MPQATGDTAKKTTTKRRTQAAATRNVKRKAPTRAASTASGGVSRVKFVGALVLAFVVIAGISFFIGTSDDGQIDVGSTISQRAAVQEASGDVEGSAATRAINTKPNPNNNVPNGGLVGRGNKETEQQKKELKPEPAASTTASTTDESATSSEEIIGEEVTLDESVGEEQSVDDDTNTEVAGSDDTTESAGEESVAE